MPISTSDAETVLGDEEDSPLSPCMWTLPIGGQQRTPKDATRAASAPNTTSLQQSPRRELRLSPASQLDVLSQISELADVQSRQSIATSSSAAAATSKSKRPVPHAHVWAPTSKRGKRSLESLPNAANVTKCRAKKQKKTQKKKTSQSQAERLAADMADWGSCSEGELFATEDDNDELLDEWVYDDISDSDFES